ncbi:MAG: saccharopine dehydrogenase NADP-binding domain-containing protein, partial [Bacteroidetes bacterium]|nr:saccharopine dehydrogenase NADP-binding domain-containing protein [Bacteroidota bacterium]MBU1677364.1 saccharopine dehydrogenase NADP-binding domain-containing protein [Bacteroidota bacterium]
MNVTVLGSGLVGSAIAKDLSKDNRHNITAVDINETALSNLNGHGIKCIPADVSNLTTLQNVIADSDIVVNAVPGGLGFLSLKNIISSGKNVVDIAFYEQDPFLLDELASENNVTALVDFGVSPGISNLLIGSSKINFDKINNLEIYVGGLPLKREQPFEYKAVFSPADVIEEYIRPARLIENGKEIIKPALSEVELMDFPGVGTLQAFNSDGLRSLLKTTDIPNMKEKTLRYPEHAEKIEL